MGQKAALARTVRDRIRSYTADGLRACEKLTARLLAERERQSDRPYAPSAPSQGSAGRDSQQYLLR